MIDEIYQDQINKNLDNQQAHPEHEPTPMLPGKFTGFWRAGGGLVAGGLEAAAAKADEVGGFGQVMAAGGSMSGGGMFALPSEAERAQNNAAHNKLMTEGVDMNSAAGDALRAKAKDFMPDAATTGAAAQVTAGLLNFGAQAVAAGAAGPAGVINLGVDQALTESDKLRQQGVDLGTRSVAGAAAGIGAAGSLFLPMTGATRLIRAAKGAVGGAGAVSGQTEAERLVLEHGGYDKIASQYDPLDPVSLALSSLVPAGFGAAFGHGAAPAAPGRAPGALHEVVQQMESGGRRYGADGKLLESPAGAQGEMQVEPLTSKDPGFGVRPAADNSPGELARVGHDYLDAMFKRYDGDSAKALAAYNAGPGKLDASIKAHGSDWLAHLPQETQSYVARGTAHSGAITAAAADPSAQAAARVHQAAEAIDAARLTPDEDLAGRDQHQQAVETASDQMARGEPVEVSDIVPPPDQHASPFSDSEVEIQVKGKTVKVPGLSTEFDNGRGSMGVMDLAIQDGRMYPAWVDAGLPGAGLPGTEHQTTSGRVRALYEHAIAEAQRRGLEFTSDNSVSATAQRVYDSLQRRGYGVELNPAARDSKPGEFLAMRKVTDDGSPVYRVRPREDRVLAAAQALDELRAARAPAEAATKPNAEAFHEARAEATAPEGEAGAPRTETPPAAGEQPARPRAAEAGKPSVEPTSGPAAAHLDAATDEILRINPDAMVQLDGMEGPVRAADLLASLREEAAADVRDSKLIEVAAHCALSN